MTNIHEVPMESRHFPETMTPKLAGLYLGGEDSPIPEQTLAVWRATKRYPIPFLKLGRLVRYRKRDLDAYMAKNTHAQTESMELAMA
jgi:hypothetical protein